MPSASAIAQKIIDVLPEAVGTIFDQHDRYESIEQRNAKGNVVIVNLPVKKRDESKRSYTVEYSGVIAFCLKKLQEHNKKIHALSSPNY